MPRMYPVVNGDMRRGKLRKFPYMIYYRELQIGLRYWRHGNRDPKLSRARIN